jgi:3-hydroxyacyl-[acyl-carrier-protein] dehydratase
MPHWLLKNIRSDNLILNSNQIQEIIPHRYPFLLIDRVIELEPGKTCVAIKNVSVNEMQFVGHFPQEHVMPGVLIIEALAQTGAVTILSIPENKGKIVYFAGIDNCKFKKVVIPGDQLRLDVTITRQKGPIGFGDAVASVNGEVAVTAQLKFAVSNK